MSKALLLLFLIIAYTACTRVSSFKQYNKLVKSELASNRRVDSIFFDIHFGMSSKEFFLYCWKMNKKGLFTDGRSNTTVLYKLDHNELKYPASMNFYPDMATGKINKMLVLFQYDAWAPWNKHLFSDSLLPDVLNFYKKWYSRGNPFIRIGREDNPIYIKVDGNRQIVISIVDDKDVKAEFTDLLTAKNKN